MISYFILSIICAFSIAFIIVEKRYDWPVKNINILLKIFVGRNISMKMSDMFYCVICLSFWIMLFIEIIFLLLFFNNGFVFLWPISGFVTATFSYITISILRLIDSLINEKEVNNGDEI
jgi:hypothetical protein